MLTALEFLVRTYSEIDELPTYGVPEVSRYLDLPYTKIRRWISCLDAANEQHLVSFTTLLELHVLKSFRLRDVTFQKIRRTLEYVGSAIPSPHPLLDRDFLTNGIDLFLEHSGAIINLSRGGQQAFRPLVELYLQRIEWSTPGPRLYPFITETSADEPRSVVIDPRVSFGKPVIAATGISTAVVAGRFMARDSIVDLAEEYRVDARKIEEAIRWELPHLNAA